MKSFSERYKEAGVDITAGYRAVELMKMYVLRGNPSVSVRAALLLHIVYK